MGDDRMSDDRVEWPIYIFDDACSPFTEDSLDSLEGSLEGRLDEVAAIFDSRGRSCIISTDERGRLSIAFGHDDARIIATLLNCHFSKIRRNRPRCVSVDDGMPALLRVLKLQT